MTLTVLQPPDWPRPKGYVNGMLGAGRTVFVAGQIGWNAEQRFDAGLVAQIEQAMRNVLAVLAEAGAGPEHVARMTWYVTDIPAYRATVKDLGPIWRALMGRHFPAMAVVGVTELVEPAALVEIEATAVLPAG